MTIKTYNYKKKTYTCKNRTRKNTPIVRVPDFGKIINQKEGWIVLQIQGDAYQRGYAHGYLLHKELKRVADCFPFIVKHEITADFDNYLKICKRQISSVIKRDFPEIYEELRGISDGSKRAGVDFPIDKLIAWNAITSMYTYFANQTPSRCTSFIATGSATKDGNIVMAHNTHCDFTTGQFSNIVLYIYPSAGAAFVMQTLPGYIASSLDWFICSTGIVGCESTIGGMDHRPTFGSPYFCRIRTAMQYGKTFDDYKKIMLEKNAGDYSCSWFFGNIHTREIMLLEIGKEKTLVDIKNDGVFYGMNSAHDFEIRNLETKDTQFHDISVNSGSRNSRLDYLLNTKYYGAIAADNAKKILSDHYDSFLSKNTMNNRSICRHGELDNESYYPAGCVDGKVVDSRMAEKMEFLGRFGSSCRRNFNLKRWLKKHPEYKEWSNYLSDFPSTKWIQIHS